MIVRELLARYGISLDKGSFDRANAATNGLKRAAQTLVSGFAVKLGFDLTREAAQFEDARKIFEASGNSLDEFREKSKGLLSDKTLVTQFNLASQFGITKDQFLEFVGIADAAAKKLGKSQEFVFESLITGTARGSKPILDNAGILLETERALSAFASRKGKKKDDLTDVERRQAIAEQVIAQGRKIVAQVRGIGATTGDVFDQWDASFGNLKTAFGTAFIPLAQKAIPVLTKLFNKIADSRKTILRWGESAARTLTRFVETVGRAVKAVGGLRNIAVVLGAYFAFSFAAQVGRAVISMGALTTATIATRLAQLALIAQTVLVGLAFVALAVVIGLLFEELIAGFTGADTLFGRMAGKWDDLRDSLLNGVDANEFWLVQVFRFLAIVVADVFDTIDTAFAWWLQQATALGDAFDEAAASFGRLVDKLPSIGSVTQTVIDSGILPGSTAIRAGQAAFGAAQRFTARPAPAPVMVDGGMTFAPNVSVQVDANGQSLDEGQLTGHVRRAIDDAMTTSLRQAQQSLVPQTP